MGAWWGQGRGVLGLPHLSHNDDDDDGIGGGDDDDVDGNGGDHGPKY